MSAKSLAPHLGHVLKPSTRLIGCVHCALPSLQHIEQLQAHRLPSLRPWPVRARALQGMDRPAAGDDPPRGNVSPHPEHPPLLAHECHVDAVGHAKRVDPSDTPRAGRAGRAHLPASFPGGRRRASALPSTWNLIEHTPSPASACGPAPAPTPVSTFALAAAASPDSAHEPPPTSNVTTAQRARGPTLVLTQTTPERYVSPRRFARDGPGRAATRPPRQWRRSRATAGSPACRVAGGSRREVDEGTALPAETSSALTETSHEASPMASTIAALTSSTPASSPEAPDGLTPCITTASAATRSNRAHSSEKRITLRMTRATTTMTGTSTASSTAICPSSRSGTAPRTTSSRRPQELAHVDGYGNRYLGPGMVSSAIVTCEYASPTRF